MTHLLDTTKPWDSNDGILSYDHLVDPHPDNCVTSGSEGGVGAACGPLWPGASGVSCGCANLLPEAPPGVLESQPPGISGPDCS